MQRVSKAYKKAIKEPLRERGYIRVVIGVFNKLAQKLLHITDTKELTYFSDVQKFLDKLPFENHYATCEENISTVDGSSLFLPPPEEGYTFYHEGVITKDVKGSLRIDFQGQGGLDIKGFTIDFGEYYPNRIRIATNNTVHEYELTSGKFITEDAFIDTSEVTVTSLSDYQQRLRVIQFDCGIVNTFTNKEIVSFTSTEFTSAICETVPSYDCSLLVENYNNYYSPDNPESTLAFFEEGQEVNVQYGYDLTGNLDIEWLPELKTYLKTWSATENSATFTTTDYFDSFLNKTYYGGKYSEEGISLYDLAIDVLTDAEVEEENYYVDPYLKTILVHNPLPVATHSACLQIIANAGRCVFDVERNSKINIRSSFIPDMVISSNGETEYSNVGNTLNNIDDKDAYAIWANDESLLSDKRLFFMKSDDQEYKYCGYVSESVSDAEGRFETNPTITIDLESQYTCYGLAIAFRNVLPKEFKIHTYNYGEWQDTVTINPEGLMWGYTEPIYDFDKMVIEFTEHIPNSRILIDKIVFGDVTDYTITRGMLTAYTVATRQSKIGDMHVAMTNYLESTEPDEKNVVSGQVVVTPEDNVRKFTFNSPSYNLRAQFKEEKDADKNPIVHDETITIVDSTSYSVTLEFGNLKEGETTLNYEVKGFAFDTSVTNFTKHLYDTGQQLTWTNPIISDVKLASDVQEWLGEYQLGDVSYELTWRGDPRIDANDIFWLELKDMPEMYIKAYKVVLNFNGAWSSTISARRVYMANEPIHIKEGVI